jgi:hypothetical protein
LKSITGYIESRKTNKQAFRNYFSDKRLESALKEVFAEKKDMHWRQQMVPAIGVDITVQSMRMLQLSKLRAMEHFAPLQAECKARGISAPSKNNFSSTQAALLEWLKRMTDAKSKMIPCELVNGK